MVLAEQWRLADPAVSRVVLVEGPSDAVALEAVAVRLGRDLAVEGTAVLVMGGVTNARHVLGVLEPHRTGVQVAALCDSADVRHVRRALAAVGLPASTVGVCVADLEDELVRAAGVDVVLGLIEAHGDRGAFRSLQQQPAHLGRRVEDQLRRFFGSGSGRKARYARLLAGALEPDRVPEPLAAALEGATRA